MTWPLHLDVLCWMVLLEGGYLLLLRRGRRLHPRENTVTRRQVTLYSLGVFTLWVAAGTPIHDWGEKYLFSVHMVEHLLISMVAPPLILLGIPGWMLRPLLLRRSILPLARVLLLPIVAIALFNIVQIVSHLPPVVDYILTHHPVHFVAHVILFSSALVMWWPVFSPMKELPRLPFGGQMIYLFVQSLVPSIVGSILTYGTTLLYGFYQQAPRKWGMSPYDDQVMAGLIMKLFGFFLLFALMTIIFFRWYNQEQREFPDALEALDAASSSGELTWPAVEDELQRMGLTNRKVTAAGGQPQPPG